MLVNRSNDFNEVRVFEVAISGEIINDLDSSEDCSLCLGLFFFIILLKIQRPY